MKSLRPVLFIAFCCLCIIVHAQHENDRWVFGGAPFPTNPPALNFFSGTAVSTPTAPVPNYWSTEAAAAVADRVTGNLLFYTDAIKVFNASNVAMPNGGATFTTNLMGCNSSTQGALILPRPGVPDHYYIFTVDCSENFSSSTYSGLRVSEVDMTLNGGLGDVVAATANTLLWGPPAHTKLTEKLTAARHTNGTDYWVVVHEWNTNNFLSFAVTCAGISTVPVISSSGTAHTGPASFPTEVLGAMKISPSGTRLALVAIASVNMVEIFDFNPATGVVSNPIRLPGNTDDYSVEFSPNSLRLYVSVYTSIPCCSGKIFQYNLAAGTTAAAIQGSKTQIVNSASVGLGGMQLGPDNKIHISRALQTNTLAVINNPDNLGGGCGFSHSGAPLSSRRSNIGLINLVDFQTGPVCAPLPVNLLYFNATQAGTKINIRWATASETGNHFFSLQKSSNGTDYTTIATIAGAGTTSQLHEYYFEEAAPPQLTYYRLTQTDFNGSVNEFMPVAFRPKKGEQPAVSFQSHEQDLFVTVTNQRNTNDLSLCIFNAFGGIVHRQKINAPAGNAISIPLPQLMEGIYYVKAELDGDVFNYRFLK